ncbi:hypothetical protein L218DRAFT_946083 [Marasmius fiardii PR-910]|nr:hypothetical protein L218DRAFT_946083 [Marasmius fiardii PR-910]
MSQESEDLWPPGVSGAEGTKTTSVPRGVPKRSKLRSMYLGDDIPLGIWRVKRRRNFEANLSYLWKPVRYIICKQRSQTPPSPKVGIFSSGLKPATLGLGPTNFPSESFSDSSVTGRDFATVAPSEDNVSRSTRDHSIAKAVQRSTVPGTSGLQLRASSSQDECKSFTLVSDWTRLSILRCGSGNFGGIPRQKKMFGSIGGF